MSVWSKRPQSFFGICGDTRTQGRMRTSLVLDYVIPLGEKHLRKTLREWVLHYNQVLRTPVQAPKANAYCERLIGTVRRECFRPNDFSSLSNSAEKIESWS